MQTKRPDLSQVSTEIQVYIEYLEGEIARLQGNGPDPKIIAEEIVEIQVPSEPPNSLYVISATPNGIAKRTSRHLYMRQRRGGMGVFDLENVDGEAPSILCIAGESQSLLLITNLGRVFRLPVNSVTESPLHGKGASIISKLNLAPGETLASIQPIQAQGYLAAVNQKGMVRVLRHHVFGEYMKPGTSLFDVKSFGKVTSACWTPGDGDLLIATRSGKAIRFSEKLVPPQGCLGIRVADDDAVIGITAVYDDSRVFFLGADGKGTIREMTTFNANKAPGAGGKIAINNMQLIAASTVTSRDDIFIVSKLGKIIRFQADEIPEKDGVVQGVICMSFRADEAVASAIGSPVTAQ